MAPLTSDLTEALATDLDANFERLTVRAWLFQITLNVVRNRQRHRSPDSVPLDGGGDDHAFDPPDDREPRPEMVAERRETNAD